MKKAIKLISIFAAAGLVLASCEGPQGKDANESCTLCHNQTVVDAKAIEFEHALHFTGEAFEEGTRNSCAPCHSHQGFMDVVANKTPATFVSNVNQYIASPTAINLPGPINCFTCHSALHTTYTEEDFMPLTTTEAVSMTMWGGAKSINFTKTDGNLCSKCHQPRPVTASTGNVIDYSKLTSAPTTTYNLSSISYRTGIHYGAQGAIAAGVGAIEFGTGYTNSTHASAASCNMCHMATPSGMSGGHSFIATGNFNGCNVSGCHTGMSATNTTYTSTKTDFTTKLGQLATKINALGNGHDILQKDPTDGKYHGYFDIYDASANPTGYWKNPANGTPAFPTLTNAQFGAIINYQLLMRGGANGMHNYNYSKKLLENSLAAW